MMKFYKTFLINLSLVYITNMPGLYISYPNSKASFLKKTLKKATEAFDELVYKTREIIRPNRKDQESISRKNAIIWFIKDGKVT